MAVVGLFCGSGTELGKNRLPRKFGTDARTKMITGGAIRTARAVSRRASLSRTLRDTVKPTRRTSLSSQKSDASSFINPTLRIIAPACGETLVPARGHRKDPNTC